MTKYTTTLNRIRAHSPCGIDPRKKPLEGYQKLKSFLGPGYGDDTPIPYVVIAQSNGLDDALWCCRAEPQYDKEWRLYAVWCARQVAHLMTDQRSKDALDVAERFALGDASQEELDAARTAAWAVAWAVARDAARTAARTAAWDAARDAAWDAARTAARTSAMDAQLAKFIEIFG